ncbi:hypothetical protein Bbelb_225550 [Branchiostoma belcheri]|nr:hypothetical protein Bbelb_225550 [Branchiostoma belcheri]
MVAPIQHLVKKDVTFVYHSRDLELARFLVFSVEGHNYSTFFRHRDAFIQPDQLITDWVEKTMRNSRAIVVIISDPFMRGGGLLDLEIAMVTAAQSQDKLVVAVICRGCDPPGLIAAARTVSFNGDFDRLKGDLMKVIQGHISSAQTFTERVHESQPIPGSSPSRPRQWDILRALEEDVLSHIQLAVITALRPSDISDKLRYIVRSSRDRSAMTFCGTAIMNATTLTLGHNIKGITQLLEMCPFTALPFSVFLLHTCYVAAHLLFYHDPTLRTLIRDQLFYFEDIMEDPDFDHIQQEADRATAEATGDHLYDHDVTFIYHDKDLDFVVEAVRYIEQQREDLKVYYRRRDSLGPILTNMVNSIQNSCITVAVISQNFLDDTLSDYELQLAILTAVRKHGQGCLPLLLDNCKIPAALETIETYHHSRDTKNGFEDLSNLVKAHLCNARRGPCLPRIKCRGEAAEPANGTALQRQSSCYPSPLLQSVDTQTLKGMIIHEVLCLFYLMVFHLKVATRGQPEAVSGFELPPALSCGSHLEHIADRRSSAPLPHLVDSCLPCSTKTPGMANLHPFTLEDDEEITFPRLRPLLSPSEISPIQSRGASGVRTATTLPGALPRTTPQVGPTPLYNQYAQSAYATGSFPGRGTVPTATSVAESNTHGTSPAGASYHQAPPPAMTQDTTNQQPSSDLRLKTRLPPTFNGTDDDFTLWLNKFDLYATSQKYTPEERAMALPTFLDHHALRFYLGLPRQARATYSTLTQRLATAFSKEHYIYTFRQSLQERTRQPGEPLIVFALDLRRLVSQAYPEYNEAAVEGLTLDYFFRGIDPTIRRRLREVQATTVDQAVKTATMLEQAATAAAWEANNAHAVDPTFHHPGGRSPFRSSDASRRSARSPSWDRTSRRPSSRDRDYHRPSSDRYRARSPSWEQSVSISLGTFRIIFHTGKRPSAGTTGRPPVDHSQARHASPTAHTTAVLDGHATRILIDTGSAISLISETLRDTIPSLRQSQLKPSFTTAKSVTGEPLDVLGVLDIHIRIGNYDTCHPVHIVRGADQTALLGWDFCVSNCVILNASRGTLTVGDEIVPLLTDTELIPQVCNASVCRITTVPPHAVMAVPVTLTPRDAHGVSLPTYVGMLEPRQHDDRGLAVARTIATTDSSQAYAQVTNTTDKPVVLQPDTPMGSFWALQDDDIADCLGPSPPAVASAGPPIDLNETDLSSTQAEQLRKLLDNYSDVFSTGPRDRGRTNLTTHRIHTGDCPPIKQRPHRTPIHRQAEIHRQVDAMLADDVIERSQSPWASPVVLARKKDGSFRFCVDYRKLNQATIKDAHPLPRTDDVIDALSGAAYFTTLDMTSGYWQVDLDPADREKTAFTTGRGLYQFKVMAFGLTNAPSTFQRLVELLLAGLDWRTCLAYLDDIIVFSRTFQDHLTTLEEVFRRCRAANLKLNAKKCQFARPRVRFLGHVVSKQGIQPDPANTEKVRHWPTPTSTAEVRAFLGLASYYRKFVRNFAHIADPLVALTRKHVRFAWDDACQKAFDSLRAALVTPPVLAYPDFTSPLTLYTDASNTAIGAVLTHPDDLGEHVISYASKTLSKQERNWSTYDRELWAIVWSVRHYRSYLAGHHFTVITDHKPLVGLSPKLISHDPTGRRARWAIELSTYQFNITYRAGKSHDNADAMSRRPPTVRDTTPSASINQSGLPGRDPTTTPTAEGPTPTVAAAADLDISEVLRWKRHRRGRPPFNDIQHKGRYLKSLWHQYPNLTVKGGILYRRWRPASRLLHQRVAPRALVPAILREMHNGPFSGHLGPAKTLRRVYIRFYWPGMTQEVKKWCRACVPCATRATPTPTARAPLRPIRADRPFSKVAMDITELPTSKHGHRYCLVVQDFFTKYVNAYPLKRQDAATVANVLFTDFIREHGIPTSLHSDQGRQFEAETMRSLYKALGIEKTRTTAYHPQGDGLVERFNRTLKDMLSKYVSTTGDDWDDHLPHVLLAYNTSVHASTGFTPFFLTHGREANLPADVIFGPNPQASSTVTSMAYARSLASSLRTAFKQVRQNTRQASNKQKLAYDVDVSHKPYQAGERVWLHDPTTVRQKLKPKWKGPYTVIERLLQDGEPGVTYRIQDTKGRKQIVHYNRLKKCHTLPQRDHAVNLRAAPATNQRDTSNPPSPAANQRDASNPPSRGTGVTTRRGRRVRPPSRYDDFVAVRD